MVLPAVIRNKITPRPPQGGTHDGHHPESVSRGHDEFGESGDRAIERNTRFAQDYLEPYQEALRVMIASSLSDARTVDLTQASSSREAESSCSDNELQVLPKL
jgi:hypothetical protein